MNINLLFEIILILFAILASNGIIYSLTFLNKKNSSENISVITNNSEKDGLALTSLIASNPIRLSSSEESSASQTLSVTSSESNVSQERFYSESSISQERFNSERSIDSHVSVGTQTEDGYSSNILEGILPSDIVIFDKTTSLDSVTVLDSQTFEQWREIAMDLHEHPINSPAGVLQQIKFEELNILYSKDIIEFAISQTELRLIIEHLPAMSLFNPEINHLILTMMAYYHT